MGENSNKYFCRSRVCTTHGNRSEQAQPAFPFLLTGLRGGYKPPGRRCLGGTPLSASARCLAQRMLLDVVHGQPPTTSSSAALALRFSHWQRGSSSARLLEDSHMKGHSSAAHVTLPWPWTHIPFHHLLSFKPLFLSPVLFTAERCPGQGSEGNRLLALLPHHSYGN